MLREGCGRSDRPSSFSRIQSEQKKKKKDAFLSSSSRLMNSPNPEEEEKNPEEKKRRPKPSKNLVLCALGAVVRWVQ